MEREVEGLRAMNRQLSQRNRELEVEVGRVRGVIEGMERDIEEKDFRLFNQIEENKALVEEIAEVRERMGGLEKAKDKIILKLKGEMVE